MDEIYYKLLNRERNNSNLFCSTIEFLTRNRLVRLSDVNPAKIAITQIGFDKCNEPTDIEESYNHTFYPIEDDDDIAKNPGYRNYK